MNKKGFTLAELLGIIVILSIIAVISVIAVDTVIKDGRYTTCQTQLKNLEEGAKLLTTDYPELLPTSSEEYTRIPVQVLQNGGNVTVRNNSGIINTVTVEGNYIEENLENPMTEKPYVDSSVYVIITITSGTDELTGKTIQNSDYEYTVEFSNNDESCHK